MLGPAGRRRMPLERSLGAPGVQIQVRATSTGSAGMAPAPNITFIMATSAVKSDRAMPSTRSRFSGATGRSATNVDLSDRAEQRARHQIQDRQRLRRLGRGHAGDGARRGRRPFGDLRHRSRPFIRTGSRTSSVNVVVQYSLTPASGACRTCRPRSSSAATTSRRSILRRGRERRRDRQVRALDARRAGGPGARRCGGPSTPWSRIRSSSPRRRSCASSSARCRATELQKIVAEVARHVAGRLSHKVKAIYPLN